MLFKYVNSVFVFALGILIGRMSVDFFATTNDIANTNQSIAVVAPPLLLPKTSTTKVDENICKQLQSSEVLSVPSEERLRVLALNESAQTKNEWQSILYETDDPDLKQAAINNLVSDEAAEELAIGLGDNSPLIRQKTLIGLGTINNENSIRMVGQTLFSDHSKENRLVAISILERNFDMPFVEHFLTFTMKHDQDPTVRQRAATSLGKQ